jgi:hypothetical protein
MEATVVALRPATRGITVNESTGCPQNGDEMAINRPNDRFSNRAFRLQASTPPAIEHLSVASPDSCTESAAEPSRPEQAMIPQQAMMKDTLSPHTPSPKTEDQVPGGGLCRLRRISTLWSTRQDAQINYLSTLSIFMKQTTYLATLPKRSGEPLNSTMVSINAPTRIGQATAMPGDVMLGRKGGVLFIPPQLAKSSESTHLRDVFGHQRLEEKKLRDSAFRGSVVERSMPPFYLSPGGGALWLPLLFGGCHPSFEGPF